MGMISLLRQRANFERRNSRSRGPPRGYVLKFLFLVTRETSAVFSADCYVNGDNISPSVDSVSQSLITGGLVSLPYARTSLRESISYLRYAMRLKPDPLCETGFKLIVNPYSFEVLM